VLGEEHVGPAVAVEVADGDRPAPDRGGAEAISVRTTGKLGVRVALTSFQSGAGLSKVRLR
jgi:hypothetical protein